MGPSMPLSFEILLAFGLIAAVAALGMVYALACMVRDGVETHDLKIRVINTRNERLAYLKHLHEGETVVTDISIRGMNSESAPASASPAKKRH